MELPDERTNFIKTSAYGITPYLSYYDTNRIRVKVDGGCLRPRPIFSWRNSKCLHCLWDKQKCQHQRLSNNRKLFVWSC